MVYCCLSLRFWFGVFGVVGIVLIAWFVGLFDAAECDLDGLIVVGVYLTA